VASSEVTPAPATAVANPVEGLQQRMARVEELLGIKSGSIAVAVEKTQNQSLGTVVVKGDRSVYHGQNDRVTLLNQVCHDPIKMPTFRYNFEFRLTLIVPGRQRVH
jgi:hypothetical protein